jgi:hypothetical protein
MKEWLRICGAFSVCSSRLAQSKLGFRHSLAPRPTIPQAAPTMRSGSNGQDGDHNRPRSPRVDHRPVEGSTDSRPSREWTPTKHTRRDSRYVRACACFRIATLKYGQARDPHDSSSRLDVALASRQLRPRHYDIIRGQDVSLRNAWAGHGHERQTAKHIDHLLTAPS